MLVLVLAVGLAPAGCAPAVSEPRPTPTIDPVHPPALRYVALGDSYTIGTSVAQEDRWPDQLVSRLAAAPPPVATLELVANHAVNGYTAGTVVRQELPRLEGDTPIGFATLLVGVNDVVQGVPEATTRADIDTIVADLLDRLPPDRILCVETPDYTVTPQGAAFGDPATQRAAIVRTNGILRERCEAAGIRFVDGTFAISQDAATDRTLVASDGLHPSGAQYRRWVIERIEPAVRELLGG
jgi:lysophospholipase L1-like esterase